MAEFERIAEQEKQAFTQASLSIYPHQAEFIDKVLSYDKSGNFDLRQDTGLTDADFQSMLSDIAAQAPRQQGDELIKSFNILCEMLAYIESGNKKISGKMKEEVQALQSSLRRQLAASIE